MSVAVDRRELDEHAGGGAERLWTVADLVHMPSDLPTGPSRDELWDGHVRLGLVPDYNHGTVCSQLLGLFYVSEEARPRPKVWMRVGVILSRQPGTVFAPDLCVAAHDEPPIPLSAEDWLESVPALVVEVRGFMESWSPLLGKAERYLRAGARQVWLVDPDRQEVTVLRPDGQVEMYRGDARLPVEEILPDRNVTVAQVLNGTELTESLALPQGELRVNERLCGTYREWSKADAAVIRQRYWTAQDLVVLPEQLPSGQVRYELLDGELRLMPPTSDDHAGTGAGVITVLVMLGQWPGHGVARDDVGVILPGEPETVLWPDAAFIAKEQFPLRNSAEGYLETVPALIVEVRSKNDTWREVERKAQRYLRAGARCVWAPDPASRKVRIYRPEAKVAVLSEQELLTAEGIIPDLSVPVKRLFEGLV